MIVTKTTPARKKEALLKKMKAGLNDNHNVTEPAKKLVGYIIERQALHMVPKPTEEGPYKGNPDLLQDILNMAAHSGYFKLKDYREQK